MTEFVLPKLTYKYEDLEPFIDAQTMEIHYSKHHATYTSNLNAVLQEHEEITQQGIEDILKNLEAIPESIRVSVRNNGGGYYNHTLFWEMMTKPETTKTQEKTQSLLTKSFGSLDAFKEQFEKKALTQFGSGWAWLVKNSEGNLEIVATANQDNPISQHKDVKILLAVDVWEHAYYLKYQNKRSEYLKNWWNVVNWDRLEALLS